MSNQLGDEYPCLKGEDYQNEDNIGDFLRCFEKEEWIEKEEDNRDEGDLIR